MKNSTKLFVATVLGGLLFSACSSDEESLGKINLAYVEWDTEVASTNVVGAVLEDLGYDVTLTPLDNAIMWESVSTGQADAMVAGWLPKTHAPQLEKYGDTMEHLGVNLEGATLGLVVPAYMDVNSIADLSDEAAKTITGIEPGGGLMAATETVMETYPNLNDWELLPSSSGAMATALGQAIGKQEEIIVTGWAPHWKFAKYDLKYLDDPEGVYGGSETINTFARENLKKDAPEAYEVLSAFEWTTEEANEVMLAIIDGAEPKEAAKKWLEENPERVAQWTATIQ